MPRDQFRYASRGERSATGAAVLDANSQSGKTKYYSAEWSRVLHRSRLFPLFRRASPAGSIFTFDYTATSPFHEPLLLRDAPGKTPRCDEGTPGNFGDLVRKSSCNR